VDLIVGHYGTIHQVVDQLRQALTHQGKILHRLDVAGISHQWPVVNGDHVDILVIQEHGADEGIGCKVTVACVAMDEDLEGPRRLEVPGIEVKGIQQYGILTG